MFKFFFRYNQLIKSQASFYLVPVHELYELYKKKYFDREGREAHEVEEKRIVKMIAMDLEQIRIF